MSDELTIIQDQQLVQVMDPNMVLTEAQKAAKALQDVISGKVKKVTFNGDQYLEFEDWQTLGKFYDITAKVTEVKFVEYGEVVGFEASAVAINTKTGMEISGAQAMCLKDEPNWSKKPLFQLKSMAQTRACSKVLRNVLAWVAVLAGYKGTPAEEMDGLIKEQKTKKPEVKDPEWISKEPVAPVTESNLVCKTCGAPTEYKEGNKKDGGKWKGYFCTENKNHPVTWIH